MAELEDIQKHQPQDVRLVLTNGTEVPVETAFVEVEGDIFRYNVVLPEGFDEDIHSIKVGVFPAKTGLGLPTLYGM